MWTKVLKSLHKYWLCFLLSLLLAAGISLTTHFDDSYISGDGYIQFDLRELYLVILLPVLSFIYGFLTYCITKNAWIPQLILLVIIFLYWFLFHMLEALAGGYHIWAEIIWTIVPVVFSFIGTIISIFVCWIIKYIKEMRK